ncbi:unnamed protein product [Dimorphilus gyrociliatus]|uniref:Uncharacterized protein n=1 Tax=Dimorphilus gyrociliatus TaxID=2664684 RepID=A0A7I8W2G2_9ANNE|nr:unnamed protein product [Dimorphilus gyrociliatus]
MAQAPTNPTKRTYLRTNPRIPPRTRFYSQQLKVENAIRMLREAEERQNAERRREYRLEGTRKLRRKLRVKEYSKRQCQRKREANKANTEAGLDKFCKKMETVIEDKEVATDLLQSLRDVVAMLDKILVK